MLPLAKPSLVREDAMAPLNELIDCADAPTTSASIRHPVGNRPTP